SVSSVAPLFPARLVVRRLLGSSRLIPGEARRRRAVSRAPHRGGAHPCLFSYGGLSWPYLGGSACSRGAHGSLRGVAGLSSHPASKSWRRAWYQPSLPASSTASSGSPTPATSIPSRLATSPTSRPWAT